MKPYEQHMAAIANASVARNRAMEDYLRDRQWSFVLCIDEVYRWTKLIKGFLYCLTEADAVSLQRYVEVSVKVVDA